MFCLYFCFGVTPMVRPLRVGPREGKGLRKSVTTEYQATFASGLPFVRSTSFRLLLEGSRAR